MKRKKTLFVLCMMMAVWVHSVSVLADNISTSNTVGTPNGQLEVSPTGAATYTIPIALPKGYGKIVPNLSLAYNSQNGYGYVGYGFSISGLSVISRGCKDIFHDQVAAGISYESADAYYLDGKRLIYQFGDKGQEGAVYVLEGDPFAKVKFHGTGTSTWIEVIKNNGVTYYYGNGNDSKQYIREATRTRVHAWYISKAFDSQGRFINYIYANSNLQVYPSLVTYGMNGGATNVVRFYYENLKNRNTQKFNLGGVEGYMTVRLSSITSETNNQLYRKYECEYDSTSDASSVKYSRLVKVRVKNGAGESLNPIVLDWNTLPSVSRTVSLPKVDVESKSFAQEIVNKSFIARDLNGDGIDDIIKVAIVKDFTGTNQYDSNVRAYLYLSNRLANGAVRFDFKKDYRLNAAGGIDDSHKCFPTGNYVADIDGDGFADVLLTTQMQYGKTNKYWIHAIMGNSLGLENLGFFLESNDTPFLATADFDHDGKDEIFYGTKNNSNGYYDCGIVYKDKIFELKKYSMKLPKEPKRLFVGDFNNDGMSDIVIIYDGGYKVFFNNGGNDMASIFTDERSLEGTSLCEKWKMEQGDFDGDGMADFVYSEEDGNTYFALNKGNGTFDVKFAVQLDMKDKNTGKDNLRFCLIPFDMDGDGKTDLLATKADYRYHGGIFHPNHYTYRNTRTEWLRSDGEKLILDRAVVTDNEEDALEGNIIVGDFMGEGLPTVMNYGKNIYEANSTDSIQMRLYANAGYAMSSGKICKITDGLGGVSTIEYASLLAPTVSVDAKGKSSFPVVDLHVSLPVVEKIIDKDVVSTYQYGGLKMHTQGIGLLGFDRTIVNKETAGEIVENSIGRWDDKFYVPVEMTSKSTMGSNEAETVTTNAIVVRNNTCFSYPSKQVSSDYDGNETTTISDYNSSYGYVEAVKTTFDNNSMYKNVLYSGYEQNSGIYLPTKVDVAQKHSDDGSEYVQRTLYTYDGYGQVVREVKHADAALKLATDYGYDKFGNVISVVSNGNGISPITKLYEYDSTGRFLTKEYQKPEAATIVYTNDVWGNVLSSVDYTNINFPLQTTYEYNGWGDLVKTVHPTGIIETRNVSWGNNATRRYCVEETCVGKPAVKTWYDYKGQKVFCAYPSLNNVMHQENVDYNSLGLVVSKTITEGKQTYTETFRYDGRGRLVENKQYEKGKDYKYSYGKRSVTTAIGNKSYTKTYDAWGNVKLSEDPLSSVAYIYNSMGKPVQITTNGNSLTFDYDEVGNRISMTDPNAGTTSYEYAADGRILKQADANGVVTKNTYDDLNRLASSKIGDVLVNHVYGTTGSTNLKLVKTVCGANYEMYSYDDYGRVSSRMHVVDGILPYGYRYEYNSIGKMSSKMYPGGVYVNYDYDENGYLKSKKYKDLVLCSLSSYDGTSTEIGLLGNIGSCCQRLDAGGHVEKIEMDNGNSIVYTYDSSTDNVLSREGMLSQRETFAYDELDRLTSVRLGVNEILNVKYVNNGNISSKSDVGNYSYGLKPHAVMSVESRNGLIPSATLTTEFNEFGKVSRILDHKSLMTTDLLYGPDLQRWKLVCSKDGNVVRTIVYDDGYDRVIEGDVVKEFYYVDDNVLMTRTNNGELLPYMVTKDNLGSIVSVRGGDGSVAFSALYDAWGKQTVSKNAIGLIRGYCGHEMLNDFDIINMNGRLYDPDLGRFFSPDNYVQMPDFSQNFNRYSYCLNNPLKYTDPSGEVFGIDDALVLAFYGAVTGMMSSGMSLWRGALAGGLSSLASYGVGSLFGHGLGTFGHELLRAGAHGLTSGTLNWINGDNFFTGAASGTAASLFGSSAQSLHLGARGVLAATSIGGGLGALATGGKFMNGLGIGMTVGTFNHNGKFGKVITMERTLPPVVCVADDLSYRKTFGYWLLGAGSGASSGSYGMWNPDAMSFSIGANLQIACFHVGFELGMVMAPGKLYPYVNYSGGFDCPTFGFDVGASANIDFFINKSDSPFKLVDLEGYGYGTGANLGAFSLNYGTGVDFLGMPSTSQYESFGVGLGAGLGIYGNSTTTQYLLHY